MLYTVVGDPHCKPDNLDKIETLLNIVEDLGNPTIWLGDMLDTKELVRSKCLNLWIKHFSESKLDHIVLVGNHDQHSAGSQSHALEPLKLIPNVTVIDEPCGIDSIIYCPYTPNLGDYLKDWVAQPLFCHADVKDFDYGNGYISDEGLDLKDFDQFPIVVSGHYHKYQKSGNLTYLGTPFSHSFGESNQEKYIGIFDSETYELDLIETPFAKHVTIEYDCDAEEGSGPSEYSHEIDKVRVILKGRAENINKFKLEFADQNVKIIEKISQNKEAETVIDETMTPEVQFEKWALEVAQLDENTVKLGMEILKNV